MKAVLKIDNDGYLRVGNFVIYAEHLEGVTKDVFVKTHSKSLRHDVYDVWNKVKKFTKKSK